MKSATSESFKPQRRALADWAIDQLYDLIFTGALPAGADLGEEELSARLGVSRATISGALRQLELDGLATIAAANGRRVVASFGVDDIYDLYTLRTVLEVHAARNAASRIDAEGLQELVSLQEEMESNSREVSRPSRRDFGVDFDFHRTIARASGSSRLETCLLPIWNQTHALLRHLSSVGAYGDRKEDAASYRDHLEVIAALRSKDADATADAMHRHLTGRRDQLIADVRARGHVT